MCVCVCVWMCVCLCVYVHMENYQHAAIETSKDAEEERHKYGCMCVCGCVCVSACGDPFLSFSPQLAKMCVFCNVCMFRHPHTSVQCYRGRLHHPQSSCPRAAAEIPPQFFYQCSHLIAFCNQCTITFVGVPHKHTHTHTHTYTHTYTHAHMCV